LAPKQEKRALHTFFTNKFLTDKFLGKELLPVERIEGSNLEKAEPAGILKYSKSDPEFADFAEW